jgi:hypothetical protein
MLTQESLANPGWKLLPLSTLVMTGAEPEGVILARKPSRELAPLYVGGRTPPI